MSGYTIRDLANVISRHLALLTRHSLPHYAYNAVHVVAAAKGWADNHQEKLSVHDGITIIIMKSLGSFYVSVHAPAAAAVAAAVATPISTPLVTFQAVHQC
jgi:hypothetical protein